MMGNARAIAAGFSFFALVCAAAQDAPGPKEPPEAEAAPAPAPSATTKPAFVRPRVDKPVFRHEQTALMELECERLASFLARHADRTWTKKLLAGDAAAAAEGRRLLTLALNLHPQNKDAVHCGLRWSDGQSPSFPAETEHVSVLSRFLLSLTGRQSPHARVRERHALLARFLTRLAADIDPANEEAIYRSERLDATGQAPPWQQLVEGRLGQ